MEDCNKSLNKFIVHIQESCDNLALKYHQLIPNKNPVIFDIGSNIGAFTKCLLKHKPNAKYHLFEPVKQYFDMSKKYLIDYDNIIFNNVGLSNKNEMRKIYVDNHESSKERNIKIKPWCDKCNRRCTKHEPKIIVNHGWNTYIKEKKHDKMSEIKTTLITLDDYCKINEINKIDFVKIDTEGFEAYVLDGFIKTLEKLEKKPYLLVEIGWGQNTLNGNFH